MVRLLQTASVILANRGNLSIPQWCDCCLRRREREEGMWSLSIPQWCDCCGAICAEAVTVICGFQSHNGAIAAGAGWWKPIIPKEAFNPTMVRLLRASRKSSLHHSRSAFNPTMVRLLRRHHWLQCRFSHLSIPQWCDCCAVRQQPRLGG